MSSLDGSRRAQYTPVTAIASVPGTDLVLAGTATRVRLASLNSPAVSSPSPLPEWTVFTRERVHRIVFDPAYDSESDSRTALVLGGKEAVLVELARLSSRDGVELTTVARFALDDFAGDAAFLSSSTVENDRILISTLHNSILVFSLPRGSTPSPPSSSCSSSSVPLLRPSSTIHAPARPLLWTSRFSSARYGSDDPTTRRIRIAGGSLLGEVLVWDLDLDDSLDGGAMEDVSVRGKLRRLNGHRGAIFTVAFCPASQDLLASGSDDRTLRVWDLSPNRESPAPRSADANEIEREARVLWGHEGRVWRIEWVDEKRLVSVAEDATCRLWELEFRFLVAPSTSSSNKAPYKLVQTWKDGHDGRTIWSVNVTETRQGGTRIALTGGADGGIRSWILPRSDATSNASSDSTRRVPQGSQIKSFVVAVDPVTDLPVSLMLTNKGSFCLAVNPSALTSTEDLEPFHSSASFANTATSLHLFYDPPVPNQPSLATLYALTNRGTYLSARLKLPGPSAGPLSASDQCVEVLDLTETSVGIKTVSCTFDETRSRLAIWERATWKVHVLSLDPAAPTLPPTRIATINVEPSLDGTTAPTAFCFPDATDSFLLVGDARGQCSLHSLVGPTATSTLVLATADVHSDGVSDLRIRPSRVASHSGIRWEVESVGRDGMRKVTEVRRDGDSWTLTVVDERWIAKGPVERILLRDGTDVRYLALVDTRAGVFDALGRLLYSFESPAKQSSSRFVETRTSGSSYFCVVQGRLTRQRQHSGASTISPIVSTGLHGREIRAVKMQRLTVAGREVVIVATAAENGVLSLSQLRRDNAVQPLYVHRYLPSSLKSLSFSTPRGSSTVLYACGTRELVTAFELEVVAVDEGDEPSVEVRVLERGTLLADAEGGEVRTMDIALVESDKECYVVAGYSNGKLRVWRHTRVGKFEPFGETQGLGKCVLSLETAKLTVDDRETLVVVSGQSDGRLSLRDLTSTIDPESQALTLPEPFSVMSPHQSGINGLSVSVRDSTILVATGGDDNAVAVERLELKYVDGRLVVATSSSVTLANAHASTIQGLDFLSPTLLALSSVEQRVNLYSVDTVSSDPTLELVESACLDVADCSAQDAIRFEDDGPGGRERWKLIIAGIGLEVVSVAGSGRVDR